MESTNFHHPQDQPSPVSSLSTPSFEVEGTTHTWTPNITLNNNACNFNSNLQEENSRSRSTVTHKNNMIQDLGYNHHWTSDAGVESCLNNNQFIKEEISFANNFPKFSELLNYTTPNSNMENYGILSSNTNTTQMKNINNDEHKDMNDLMLKTLFTHGDFYNAQNHLNFRGNNTSSQIHPSINISNLNQYSSSSTSNTLDMNMQSLDLLTNSPTSFTTQHSQDDHDNLSFRLHPMQQQPTNGSSRSSNNSINNHNGAGETKRGCTLIESKASPSAFKKSRSSSSESRPSSCPPFKVRKEKLGDRIAALQQLVAPFGKTDTASVLMEAIGYIKFLQGQVETLSVPYMKPSQKQNMQGGSGTCDTNREAKQDLISRGLCLVPLSCMSYIATDEMWQQRPNFGGPT